MSERTAEQDADHDLLIKIDTKVEMLIKQMAAQEQRFVSRSEFTPLAALEDRFVTKSEFGPVRLLAYGAVGLTLSAVVLAVIGLVIIKG